MDEFARMMGMEGVRPLGDRQERFRRRPEQSSPPSHPSIGAPPELGQAGHAWARAAAGREAEPSAGIIDSQSVKTAEAGGPRGYDAGKKIKGRKRHIVTDTLGNMLEGVVHGADVQDRDGAPGLIGRSCDAYPALTRLFADGGYAGQKLEAAVAHIDRLTIAIIRRSDLAGFVILPRRWVVERTLAWLNRCRRLAKDWKASIASSEAWMVLSSIRRMTRRIAKLEL